jgi:hypothetical protein
LNKTGKRSIEKVPEDGAKEDELFVEHLRNSIAGIGILNKPIVCKQHPDRILSGKHREKALGSEAVLDKLEFDVDEYATRNHISHESAEILVTTHSNIQRKVSMAETRGLILDLANDLVKEGCPKEKVGAELTKLLPFSPNYVLALLPKEYKQSQKAVSPGRPKSVKPFVNVDKQNEKPQSNNRFKYEISDKVQPPSEGEDSPKGLAGQGSDDDQAFVSTAKKESIFRTLNLSPNTRLITSHDMDWLEIAAPVEEVQTTIDCIRKQGFYQIEIHVALDPFKKQSRDRPK